MTTTGVAYINDHNIADLVEMFIAREPTINDMAIEIEKKIEHRRSIKRAFSSRSEYRIEESRKKLMTHQMDVVTKGKNIIFSNKGKL